MNQRTITLIIALFVLVVIGMFAFTYIQRQQMKTDSGVNTTPTESPTDMYSDIVRIEGKHFFIDGTHTVVGEIAMPTPCDLLESSSVVAESYPEQITLDFKVINNAESCAQIITPQRFKVSAEASAGATFKALFQNRVVELNLIEALPGETPEDFELFIKG